jgi:VRR-NUC domain
MGARRSRGLSEKQYQQQVTDLCDWLGLRYYHTYDSRRSPSGFPDLVIVGRWRTIFVELKSESGRLSAKQAEWINDLRQTGQYAHVVRPSDWEWFKQTLFVLAGRKVSSGN